MARPCICYDVSQLAGALPSRLFIIRFNGMDHHRASWQTLTLVTLSVACSIVVHCSNSVRSKGLIAADHPAREASVSFAFTTVVQGAATGGKDARPFLHLIQTD